MKKINVYPKYYKIIINSLCYSYVMEYENGKYIFCSQTQTCGQDFPTIYQRENDINLSLYEKSSKIEFGIAYSKCISENLQFILSKI